MLPLVILPALLCDADLYAAPLAALLLGPGHRAQPSDTECMDERWTIVSWVLRGLIAGSLAAVACLAAIE
jgi:hypothetical protein